MAKHRHGMFLYDARLGAVVALLSFFCIPSFGAAHRFTVTLNAGDAASEDVPVALRLSTMRIRSFDYATAGDGTHFEIYDENGAILPYEIDTWNPGGESLLWVKVPFFAKGRNLTVVYGRTNEDMTARAAEVWANYIGVWHMNGLDASNKYPNSTGDARFVGEVSSFSRTGRPGKFGQSVQVFTNDVHSLKGVPDANEKGGVFIPDGGNLDLTNNFALSGWFSHETVENPVFTDKDKSCAFRWDNIFCKRRHPESNNSLNNGSTAGFALRIGENNNSGSKLEIATQANRNSTILPSVLKNGSWRHIAVSFDANGRGWTRVDGASVTNHVALVTDNDEPLAIGNTAAAYPDNGGDRAWGGYADEVRLFRGCPSDAYLAAEYAAMANEHEYIPETCLLVVDKNEHFDDSVTISSDIPPVMPGEYYAGTTITLMAHPNATGTFRKWYGDVPRESRTNATVSFVIERDSWVYARFVHPWTLAADKTTMTNGHFTTMSDGHFTINVSVKNASLHMLTVGLAEEAGLSPANDTGVGTVDLGGPILLEGDAVPWTIGRFEARRGSQSIPISREGKFRYLSPGTVSITYNTQLFHRGDTSGSNMLFGACYDMIILDEPVGANFIDQYFLANQAELDTLIFEIPNVTELKGARVPYNMPLSKTKFDWWDLSSVSVITNAFFANKWGDYLSLCKRVPISGALSLPSMRGLNWVDSTGVNVGSPLYLMENVEEISLGGKDEETTVTNLCTYAFAGDSSLKKLTLHAAPDMQVGTRIFAEHTYETFRTNEVIDGVAYSIGSYTLKGRVPDVIRFTGRAISETAIENLLDSCPAVSAAAKPVVIYASRYQDGWYGPGRAGWISLPTAAERAAYSGRTLLGVFRAGGEAPSGKAVIIHCGNAWDKVTISGFQVKLR
ncbi:MAG: hypothetical protein J5727_08490 [Kiritimatiellae bacterium]|nr:hypothetical protein [Kiritimatiellia bacterium]